MVSNKRLLINQIGIERDVDHRGNNIGKEHGNKVRETDAVTLLRSDSLTDASGGVSSVVNTD